MESETTKKRYRARPMGRWSINANQHKQRRQYNLNDDILAPTKMHEINPICENTTKTESNHNDERGQLVIHRSKKEDSEHLPNLISCLEMKHEVNDDNSLEIRSDEYDTTRVLEHNLRATNEDSSRPVPINKHFHHTTHDRSHQMEPMRRIEDNPSYSQRDNHEASSQPNLSCNLTSSEMRQVIQSKQHRRYNFASDIPQKILLLFIMNVILSQLSNNLTFLPMTNDKLQYRLQVMRIFPTVISALATTAEINAECFRDSDCGDMRCYQGKCICPKDRPIEDRGICLSSSVAGEVCSVSEQCLGNSLCLDGYCSCGNDTISLYNPSSRINYCHPKRRLREECSHDAQCPSNSFCSTNKCLCQNGYGPVTVKGNDGAETIECLPKSCSSTKDCESEYHICEDNRCICLADHFDPHTAECYKFGSTGGKLSGNQTIDDNAKSSTNDNARDNNKGFVSILKDLMKNSDKLWYVIVILAVLTIILLALIVMSLRKYFLGYCWTAHKKEYEPNNKSAPKSGYFNKDSINNKSFRQKNGEVDDDGDDNDDTAADRSNLVTTVNKGRGAPSNESDQRLINNNNNKELADTENRYVKVDMRVAMATEEDQQQSYEQANSTNTNYQPYHQQLLSLPLSTSNSTAV